MIDNLVKVMMSAWWSTVSLLLSGYILCCLTVYCANLLRKHFFYKNKLTAKQSNTFIAVICAIFVALSLHSYNLVKSEKKFLSMLENGIALKSVKGSLISVHSYNEDWDLVHFKVGEQVFYYRLEEVGRFDFDLNQKELQKFEGDLVEVKFTETGRIVSLKILGEGNI